VSVIRNHDSNGDWCHVCGKRSSPTADVRYPENAEHASKEKHSHQAGKGIHYIRICSNCAKSVLTAATGQIYKAHGAPI
jgi:hypothetical protein